MYRGVSAFLFATISVAFGQASKPPAAPVLDTSAIDRTVSPCSDFYRYACGSWMKANPIPPDQSQWGRFNELAERNRDILRDILEKARPANASRSGEERQFGDFYESCMDEAAVNAKGIAPLKPLLDEIAALKTKIAVTDAVISLHRRGIRVFFNFGSTQDAKDATKMIAEIDQGGLSLPDRDYYLKTDAKSVEIRDKFTAYVQRMFELAGDPSEVAAAKAKTVMRMETDMAKGSLDLVSRRDPNKTYHKYTVAQLISLEPGLDWQRFFTGLGVAGLETLNLTHPPFMRALESVTVQNSLDDIKTYLSWQVLDASAPNLSEPFVKENWGFYDKTLEGAEQQRPRWKRCVSRTDSFLGDALGKKYVERTFGAEGKQRTLAMVREIESAMERDIESLAWMTPATRKQALEKLHAITNKIGYPDKWKDYSNVKIARDDWFGNMLRIREWHVNYYLAKIGKPVDKAEWSMSPPTVNAYYNPQMNDINFPAGILQPPFYSNAAGDAPNYGAIGSVIGHELTHGFDDEGRQFDAAGNLRDWWTGADAKAFEQRADCIASQYGGYTAVDDVKVNGRLTLGENVADNGGVRIALMALNRVLGNSKPAAKDGFTAAQQFYLGFAQLWCSNTRPEFARMLAGVDPHSPAEFRVNGVLSNDPDFWKAFSCKPGQPMVRAEACRIW